MWVEKVAGLLEIPYIDIFNKAARIVKKSRKYQACC
jgi:hypothetical protein